MFSSILHFIAFCSVKKDCTVSQNVVSVQWSDLSDMEPGKLVDQSYTRNIGQIYITELCCCCSHIAKAVLWRTTRDLWDAPICRATQCREPGTRSPAITEQKLARWYNNKSPSEERFYPWHNENGDARDIVNFDYRSMQTGFRVKCGTLCVYSRSEIIITLLLTVRTQWKGTREKALFTSNGLGI